MAYEHRTGRVNSGDVTLFYRVFGKAGATPILILHGSNYYDSVDWIEVASALATDREVVVPDRRGWGDSTWSPSKDNSLDALLDDMLAVMGVMKWPKAIVMGHSGAGPTIISFAVNFPQMTEKLILVDSQMNREESARTGKSVGNPPYVFELVEAAMAKHKFSNPPRFSWDRKRAEQSLVKVEKGLMLKRDPDGGNRQPIGEGAALPRRPVREMWEELGDGQGADDRHPRQPFVALSGGDGRAAHQELSAHPAGRGRFRARRRRPGARGADRACTEVHRGHVSRAWCREIARRAEQSFKLASHAGEATSKGQPMRTFLAAATIALGSLGLASVQASPVVPGGMTSAVEQLGGDGGRSLHAGQAPSHPDLELPGRRLPPAEQEKKAPAKAPAKAPPPKSSYLQM